MLTLPKASLLPRAAVTNCSSLNSSPKQTEGRERAGRGRSLYQSQWKYKVLTMLNEEIWALGYFCGSEVF